VRERSAPPVARPPTVRRPAAQPGEPHFEPAPDYDFDQRAEGGGLAVGARVRHPSLGEGIVRAVDGAGADAKVTVAFLGAGEKRVIARFLQPG
jgi:DNA helicase-2/ATP-dependent DNA helicase PcrA